MEDARVTLRQEMMNLDVAIAISGEVLKVDCAKRSADFAAVSPNDAMRKIAALFVAGQVNERVIYLLARYSSCELIEQRRRISENSRRPRQPRVDVEQIIKIGRTLQGHEAREITGIVQQRLGDKVSPATIRKHLRIAEIIPSSKKKGN